MELRVCIDVDDLDRAVEFYRRAFGFSLGRRLGSSWAELGGAPVPVDLLAKGPGSRPTPAATVLRVYERHWTPVHLDLVVDDLEAAVVRAVAAGARLERDVEVHAFGRLALLADPFGHGFCLLQFTGRGYDEVVARMERP